ncbi:hypothetical protein [Candidatus Viridilinea mediisalina]|uniref:hypothetical protein n=1 Tax=Candidatus Viridilinea mediisalina TaxID=2024553 RepID=UPI000F595020|nr:hypothetical protein [Candidatus Viridilinea mediisalina]
MRTIPWNNLQEDVLPVFGLYSPNASLERIDISKILRRINQRHSKAVSSKRVLDSVVDSFISDTSSVFPRVEVMSTTTTMPSTASVLDINAWDIECEHVAFLRPTYEAQITARITDIELARPPRIDAEEWYG